MSTYQFKRFDRTMKPPTGKRGRKTLFESLPLDKLRLKENYFYGAFSDPGEAHIKRNTIHNSIRNNNKSNREYRVGIVNTEEAGESQYEVRVWRVK